MKRTIETEIRVDWAKIYQELYDELKEDDYEPDKYEILDCFEVNSYHILCDYFGYPEFDENGNLNEEEWFSDSDVESACDEFEEYIESLKE